MTERVRPEILSEETILQELMLSARKMFKDEKLNYSTVGNWLDELVAFKEFHGSASKWIIKHLADIETEKETKKRLILRKGDFIFEVWVTVANKQVTIEYYGKQADEPTPTLDIVIDRLVDRQVLIPPSTAEGETFVQDLLIKISEYLQKKFSEQNISLNKLGFILTEFLENNPTLLSSLPQPVRVRRVNRKGSQYQGFKHVLITLNDQNIIIFIRPYEAEKNSGTLIGIINQNPTTPLKKKEGREEKEEQEEIS